MFYYRCPKCAWIQEGETYPTQCDRCKARKLQHLSVDEFLDAVDKGEATYCAACKIIHVR